MSAQQDAAQAVESYAGERYKYGFVTDIETETAPKGLSEDIVRFISAKKEEPEWLLEWRLKALPAMARHARAERGPRSAIRRSTTRTCYYYAAPKTKERPKSLDEVDPELLRTYEKLGIPLKEQELLAGVVAVDAVFDSVSVATTYKAKLTEMGVIFCSISEAVREHPELVRKHLGSVVPRGDNYFAALNSAVFTDGSFVYIPKGCAARWSFRPISASTPNTGQFERTLIVADEGSYVSYLEGCTAPQRDENQLHAAVVELVALDDAEIKYSTVQNWYPGDENGAGRHLQFRDQAGRLPRPQLENLLDPGGDRIGDHLEIPELPAPGRELDGRVLLRRHHQQRPAGRHRHQDDPYRPQHPLDHRLQGDQRRAGRQHLSRPGQGHAEGGGRAQPHPVRQPADRRQVRRPHRALHRIPQPDGAGRARGDHVEDRRGPAFLLYAARHRRRRTRWR